MNFPGLNLIGGGIGLLVLGVGIKSSLYTGAYINIVLDNVIINICIVVCSGGRA